MSDDDKQNYKHSENLGKEIVALINQYKDKNLVGLDIVTFMVIIYSAISFVIWKSINFYLLNSKFAPEMPEDVVIDNQLSVINDQTKGLFKLNREEQP